MWFLFFLASFFFSHVCASLYFSIILIIDVSFRFCVSHANGEKLANSSVFWCVRFYKCGSISETWFDVKAFERRVWAQNIIFCMRSQHSDVIDRSSIVRFVSCLIYSWLYSLATIIIIPTILFTCNQIEFLYIVGKVFFLSLLLVFDGIPNLIYCHHRFFFRPSSFVPISEANTHIELI